MLTLCPVQTKVQAPRSEGEVAPSNPSEAACLGSGPSLSTSQINSQVTLDDKNLGVMQPTSETAEWKLEDIHGNCQTANDHTVPLLSVFPGQVCSPSLDIDQDWHSEHSLTMSVPSSNGKSTVATAPSLKDESGVNKTTADHSQDMSEMDDWLRNISLEQYAGAIKEYGYDSLEALDSALEADLEEMSNDPAVNMNKHHRRLLMDQWKLRTQTSLRGAGQPQSAKGEWIVEDYDQGWISESVSTDLNDSGKKCEHYAPEVENMPVADMVAPVDARTHPAPVDPAPKYRAPTDPALNKSEAQSRTSTGEGRMTAAFTATNTKVAGQRKPSGIPLTKAAAPRLTTPLRSTSGSVNRRGGRGVEAAPPSSASLRRMSANKTDKQ